MPVRGGATPLVPKIAGFAGVQSVPEGAPERATKQFSGVVPFGSYVTELGNGQVMEAPVTAATIYGVAMAGNQTRLLSGASNPSAGPAGNYNTRSIALPNPDRNDQNTADVFPVDRLGETEDHWIYPLNGTATQALEGQRRDFINSGGRTYLNLAGTSYNQLYIKQVALDGAGNPILRVKVADAANNG